MHHQGVAPGDLVGVGLDAPGVTPPARLRFDAAMRITAEDVHPAGNVALQTLEPRTVAITTHVGPYATLPKAYAIIAQRLTANPRVTPQWLPVLEFYQTTRTVADAHLNHTDICIPVHTGATPEEQ